MNRCTSCGMEIDLQAGVAHVCVQPGAGAWAAAESQRPDPARPGPQRVSIQRTQGANGPQNPPQRAGFPSPPPPADLRRRGQVIGAGVRPEPQPRVEAATQSWSAPAEVLQSYEPTTQWEDDSPRENASSSRRRVGIIAAVSVVVVALTIAGVVILRGQDGGPDPVAETPGPTASDLVQEPSSDVNTRPVPAGSTKVSDGYFIMPSSNIACRIAGQTVDCEIRVADYARPGDGGEQCAAYGWGNLITLTSGQSPKFSCGPASVFDASDQAIPFEYGTSIHTDVLACTSSKSGVECWDVKSSAGFLMSRYSQKFT